MTSVQLVNVDDILGYFDVCFGEETGKLHIASGWDLRTTDSGKLEHQTWTPTCFDYPAEARLAADELARSAIAGADVYVCPYLMHGDKRHKGAAKTRRVLHADVDSRLDLEKINKVGGCVVISGSPDHGHVYVRLNREVTHVEHQTLERGLVHYLNADPGKISENDVLRPPGTLNQKPTVSGNDPAPVMWMILPNGKVEPESIASTLGISLAADGLRISTQIGSPEPVNLGDHPTVVAALAKTTIPADRSLDTDHIVRACYDSGLTLDQARWVVNCRTDLAERLADRPNTDDDVGRCWLKIDEERRKSTQSSAWMRDMQPPTQSTATQSSVLQEIEQGFWDSRESLRQIYTTALAMMASPWAVLGICAARGLTTVRPVVTLPPLIGGPGSLNWFCALVARSGGGKGAAGAAAKLLIPEQLVREKNLGSGEGLVALFGRSADEDDPTPIHEALLINVDEVDTLTALGQRSGSTTMSVLRSAFMGESLGFSYADKSKRRDLRGHTYRMTMVVAVQPRRSAALFADEGGGTPQRFMWFPAKDTRISMDELWPTGPLTLPEPSEWIYPRELIVPNETKYAIRYNRMLDAQDRAEALDGHALFCREKFAYALAILDGRIQMTLEDWELSGIAAEISNHTRQLCIDQLREASRIDAMDRGEIRGIENSAAEDAKEFENAERIRSVLRWALEKIGEAGEEGIPQRDLAQKRSGRDRRWLPSALQIGVSNGLIRQLEGTTIWVKI